MSSGGTESAANPVVCAHSEISGAPLWWIELETRRAVIAPPIWKPGRCGDADLAEALVHPLHSNAKASAAINKIESVVLERSRQVIRLVEEGAPLILASRAIGSAFIGISPTFRLATDPEWAEIYCSLRIAGQSLDDWEIAAELSCGFDVHRWVRLPLHELTAQFVLEAFSSEQARVIKAPSADYDTLVPLSAEKLAHKEVETGVHDFSDLELPFLALGVARERYSDLCWRLICPPAPGIVYAMGYDRTGTPIASLRYGDGEAKGLSDIIAARICGFAPIDIVAGRGHPPAYMSKSSTWLNVG